MIRPSCSVKPLGWFIHEFADTTDSAPSEPATTIGVPDHQWTYGERRSQPYR
jgi:hypothetical protein